jgi:hypothetical protein
MFLLNACQLFEMMTTRGLGQELARDALALERRWQSLPTMLTLVREEDYLWRR